MDMNYNSLVLVDGRNCKIYQSEGTNCLLIQPIDEHDFAVLEKEVNAIRSLTRIPFTLVTFEIKDWQSDLTPWSAPAVFGKVPFGDGAVATLSFITDKLISPGKRCSQGRSHPLPQRPEDFSGGRFEGFMHISTMPCDTDNLCKNPPAGAGSAIRTPLSLRPHVGRSSRLPVRSSELGGQSASPRCFCIFHA